MSHMWVPRLTRRQGEVKTGCRTAAEEYIYFCARERLGLTRLAVALQGLRLFWGCTSVFFKRCRKQLKRVYLSQVGGGAFSFLCLGWRRDSLVGWPAGSRTRLGGSFSYHSLKKESLQPVQDCFECLVLSAFQERYRDIETKELAFIPDWAPRPFTALVNFEAVCPT